MQEHRCRELQRATYTMVQRNLLSAESRFIYKFASGHVTNCGATVQCSGGEYNVAIDTNGPRL